MVLCEIGLCKLHFHIFFQQFRILINPMLATYLFLLNLFRNQSMEADFLHMHICLKIIGSNQYHNLHTYQQSFSES